VTSMPAPFAMPSPVAVGAAGPAAQQMLSVIVPEGSWPGQALQVSTPCGHLMQVRVPDGALPGQTFSVAYSVGNAETIGTVCSNACIAKEV
jgi:hypothetical protein